MHLTFYSMGRTSLTFGRQFGDEVKLLYEDEIKPLSEVELLTLSHINNSFWPKIQRPSI